MRVLLLLLAAALLIGLAGGTAPARATSCTSKSGFYVASLNADIDPGAANFVSTSVSNAEAACDASVVLVMNTSGGDGNSMESVVSSISSYQQWGGTFITLVAPEGALAYSAGAYVAEASNSTYMVNGTAIGDATPSSNVPGFTAYMQTLTSANDRNATATGLMVSNGTSYTGAQAAAQDVITATISTDTVAGALQALGVPTGTPTNTPGVSSILISLVSNPDVATILFLAGIFAILVDIFHPTLVLSFVGVAVVALALFGLGTFGASPLAVALMIIGAAFIFLEVKTQHGISAILGVIIFVVGFLFVFQFPAAAASSTTPGNTSFSGVPAVTYALVAALAVTIVISSLYLRNIRQGLMSKPKVYDSSRTIGKTGVMKTDLAAGGRGDARIGAEEWTVTSSHDLRQGDAVKVIDVEGLQLVVEKAGS